MAKTATAKKASDDGKKKKAKSGTTIKVKVKANKGKGDKGGKAKSKKSEGFEGIAKFVDHPMVADLLAAGAMAAVALLASTACSSLHCAAWYVLQAVATAAMASRTRRARIWKTHSPWAAGCSRCTQRPATGGGRTSISISSPGGRTSAGRSTRCAGVARLPTSARE